MEFISLDFDLMQSQLYGGICAIACQFDDGIGIILTASECLVDKMTMNMVS